MDCENSLTGRYLKGTEKIDIPLKRRKGNKKYLEIKGAKENNLKIDFSKRETLSSKDLFLKDCKSFVYNLNPALIVKIQNWLYHHSQKK